MHSEELSILALVASAVALVIAIRQSRESSRVALEHVMALNERLIMALTGLNPHVVRPDLFGPTGMAREDEQRQASRPSPSGAVTAQGPPDFESAALREAERHFFAQQQKRAKAAAVGDPHNPT